MSNLYFLIPLLCIYILIIHPLIIGIIIAFLWWFNDWSDDEMDDRLDMFIALMIAPKICLMLAFHPSTIVRADDTGRVTQEKENTLYKKGWRWYWILLGLTAVMSILAIWKTLVLWLAIPVFLLVCVITPLRIRRLQEKAVYKKLKYG